MGRSTPAWTCVRLLQLCPWLQQPGDHLHYIMMQISIGFSFFLLFCMILLFDCVMKQSQCCLCKYNYNNAYVSTKTHISLFFQTKTIFSISHLTLLITLHNILWLLQTSCSIFIDIACYNHSRVFDACFTISM